MDEKKHFALVRKPVSALEKAEPGTKRILSGMMAETLALNTPSVENWLQLGKNFYFGYGVSKSYKKAFTFFSRAAAAGHLEAQFHVALCFEDGDGVQQDKAQAAEWYLKSAIGGFGKAQNNLAVCYRDGQGLQREYAQAEKWYLSAAALGYAPTMPSLKYEAVELGLTIQELLAFQNPKKPNSIDFYYHYKYDHGAPKDGVEAIKWYRMKADQGCVDAQTDLGICYEFGHGVPQDFSEAARWYRMAAEKDCPNAQNKLIVGIQSGLIAPLNNDEEKKWYNRQEMSFSIREFRRGAEKGEAGNQIFLGICYEQARGIPQDIIEAYKW